MEKKIIKSLIIFFSLFILLIFITTCFSASESYFVDVSYDAKKLPIGIEEIKDLDGNKRYYKIRTYRGKVLTLSSHDYDGTLRVIDFEERNAAKIEYQYDADGNLVKIIKYNTDLKPVKTEVYKPKKKK